MGQINTEAETDSTESDKKTQVLEFGLGDEIYCLDINVIDEIVDANDLTPIPNSAPHVEGVMDLRGRTTTIVNPNTVFNSGQDGVQNRIIVLDPDVVDDDTTTGWIVDEVYQVRTVTREMIDEGTTANDENVKGIVKTDDKFVVWVSPDIATA